MKRSTGLYFILSVFMLISLQLIGKPVNVWELLLLSLILKIGTDAFIKN